MCVCETERETVPSSELSGRKESPVYSTSPPPHRQPQAPSVHDLCMCVCPSMREPESPYCMPLSHAGIAWPPRVSRPKGALRASSLQCLKFFNRPPCRYYLHII